MKHLKEAHPDKLVEYMAEMRQKKSSSPAKDSGAVPENTPKTKTTATTTKTTDYRQANVFAFVPKKFEFSSTLLPLAKQVSMEVWGWPDYEMSDFVDTFIYACLRAAGIKVAHYQVENPEELAEEAEPQGNGHGDIDELKAGLAQLNGKFDVLLSAIVKAGGK